MSTIQKVNFEPVSDILPVWRKDLPLADPSLADPLNAVALIDGEWLTLDANYRWARPVAIGGVVGTCSTVRSFLCFNERGRSDRMGMADKKTTALFSGSYEGDTRVYDAAAAVGNNGAAITTVMQPLKVALITIGARNFIGLVGCTSATTDAIVGYVTRLPASNGGKLRFLSGYRS